MFNKSISVMAMLLLSLQSVACDVCGCAINPGGGEIVPGMFQHYFGARSNIRSFSSQHLTLFEDEIPLKTEEWFHTTEFHFRYSPHRRVQIFGFVPINALWKLEEEVMHTIQGMGDFRLRANYVVIDKKDDESGKPLMNLFLGSSLKMPTGRSEYRNTQEQSLFHRNMLPGTGSWDVAGHFDFVYGKNNFGGMLNATYMWRGSNNYQYDFGNLFVSQLTGFYKHKMNGSSFLFELGVSFVDMQPDLDTRWNELQVYSQGTMLAPMARVSYFKNNWMFQTSANKAAWEDMAQGQVSHNYHLEVGVMYFINGK